MAINLFKKLIPDDSRKMIKKIEPVVAKINALEAEIHKLDDVALGAKTKEFQDRLAKGETLDDLLPEAFAVVREAALRTLGQRHYDVQLFGGIVLHQGNVAEMMTGEGKTLVATLPVYLNALTGKGVHVITVNDYLSRRDAVWMGQVYAFLGLSSAVINHDSSFLYDPAHQDLDAERDEIGGFKVVHDFLRPCTRKEAYDADITYGTNNEFGFDYLRDNIAYQAEHVVQREHHYAIVDEIDSILIDEARTPLIISAPTRDSESLYVTFAEIASRMKEEDDYTIDEKLRAISMTDEGISKAEAALGVENIYTDKGIKYVHHLETAVRAKALFQRDKSYVVKDGEIIIVDEFTGRLQPGRRWSEGLHQAIEAKEGVAIQQESRTFASVTFQNYFRMYEKLAGMTGTAKTSAEEFFKVYSIDVVSIPTNRPITRIDHHDLIFQTEAGKLKAVTRKIKELNDKGQPVLVGTVSIEHNELLSAYLRKEGVPHEILNAKNHEREGEVIAQAGKKGRVTIATNMAGRGVDIKLGGNPSTDEEYEEVKRLGGLFVIGTERHDARRIDNQLRGRSGRQGDPGETQFFVSFDDDLMRVFATDTIKKMMGKFGIPEDEPVENRMITKSLESAQTKIEGFHFDARKSILEYDDVMNRQRTSVYGMRRKILLGKHDDIQEFLVNELSGDDVEGTVKKKIEAMGEDAFYASARAIILQTIDMLWMEHLEAMDYMRSSVNLRAYGQRDPLVEYKNEGTRMFKEMQEALRHNVGLVLENIEQATQRNGGEEIHTEAQTEARSNLPPKTVHGSKKLKIGRNDPCPCGSGKKYKKCHGA